MTMSENKKWQLGFLNQQEWVASHTENSLLPDFHFCFNSIIYLKYTFLFKVYHYSSTLPLLKEAQPLLANRFYPFTQNHIWCKTLMSDFPKIDRLLNAT